MCETRDLGPRPGQKEFGSANGAQSKKNHGCSRFGRFRCGNKREELQELSCARPVTWAKHGRNGIYFNLLKGK